MSSKNPAKALNASSAAAWMERLRAKASSYRSAADLSRATRTTLLDRRTAPDAADRLVLRTSLDQLASAVPARDAASLADRLEAISKQVAERWAKRGVALNFMAAPVHGCYYLSTDCFYVEINIEGASGRIVEAKVHHIDSNHPNQQASTPKNCPEIINCLTKGDFNKFIDHLEGLMSIYDMPNASAQDKTRGWHSLSILEADLIRIDNLSRYHDKDDLSRVINYSPMGFVQARAGGLPLKCTYFISPQDKIDMSTKSFRILNATTINENNLGVSATIGIERSEKPRALPLQPLISAEGKEMPITERNSVLLPANFVLHLNTDLPLEASKYDDIVAITGISFIDTKQVNTAPLLQLITRSTSDKSLDSSNNRGLFVTLPDQSHCYFLSDHDSLNGYVVKKIPFSHPAQVPRILATLKKQAVFNSILSSCIRTSGIQDLEKSILFEVSCMDIEHICVTFEMSQERGMQSFELDFSDLRNVLSIMHKMSSSTADALTDVVAKAVFDRSLSLPLTMRALTHQLMKRPKKEPDPDGLGDYGNSNSGYSHYNNGNLENGNNGGVPAMDMDFHSQPPSLKVEPMDTYERNNGSPAHLNANRPQDAASIPGARSKITPNTSAAQPLQPPKVPSIKVTKTADSSNRQDRIDQDRHHSHSKTGADRYTTKSDSKSSSLYKSNSNHLEIKALKSKPSSGAGSGGTGSSSYTSTGNATTTSSPSSSTSSKSQSGSSSVVSKTASKMGSDIKPSVSITPVSSADAATLNMKKPAGIEIIPLGDKLPENESSSKKSGSGSSGSSDSKSGSLLKEIKRSLSEDDKRRMEKKDGKKRKRDQFILKNETSPSHKKSKQYSSSNSSSGGSGGSGGSGSSGTGSTTNKKLTSVIDRLSSSSHNDSGIEIIPRNDKIKSPSQQQQGLKLTIKSTSSSSGGGSGSGSSSSKHRSSSDYHHKSSSGSSSSKHSSSGSSKHSSSSSSAKRSSPSISQMTGSSSSSSSKHSKSPSSSSSLLKSSSSSSLSGSTSSSSKADRAQRDKDRIEEVKRLLGGNKLDTTTFQIPKRTKPESGSNSIISNSSTNPTSQPSLSKSANASPKYNTSPSPKYGVSPKPPSLSPSTGNSNSSTTLLNNSAPSPPHLAAFDKAAGCDKDINIGINNSK